MCRSTAGPLVINIYGFKITAYTGKCVCSQGMKPKVGS